MDQRETLRTRLRERLSLKDKSAHAISLEIGANPGYVRDLLDPEKTSMPSAARLRALASSLDTTTDYLLGTADISEQPRSEVSFHDVPAAWRGPSSDGIKLLGTGYCDDLIVDSDSGAVSIERLQLELDHVIRLVERPAALWNAKEAYAIYFHGSSMEPRFYQGEVGIVDPRRPPSPGDFVVVQLTNGASDTIVTVLVKQLVRVGGGFVELRQLNPELTFKLPRGMVARMHRIFTPNELLGI